VVDWFLIKGALEDERDRLAALLGHLPACGVRMALKDRALGQVDPRTVAGSRMEDELAILNALVEPADFVVVDEDVDVWVGLEDLFRGKGRVELKGADELPARMGHVDVADPSRKNAPVEAATGVIQLIGDEADLCLDERQTLGDRFGPALVGLHVLQEIGELTEGDLGRFLDGLMSDRVPELPECPMLGCNAAQVVDAVEELDPERNGLARIQVLVDEPGRAVRRASRAACQTALGHNRGRERMMVDHEDGGSQSPRNVLIPLHVVRRKADVRKDDFIAGEGRRVGPGAGIRGAHGKVERARIGLLRQQMGSA
jgi:hypothetical protein